MNRKNILIITIVTAFVLVALITIIIFIRRANEPRSESGTGQAAEGSLQRAEFMTAEDKTSFQLLPESRVQIISRDADGAITVYKIIGNESEVVADPSRLPPLSPAREDNNSSD